MKNIIWSILALSFVFVLIGGIFATPAFAESGSSNGDDDNEENEDIEPAQIGSGTTNELLPYMQYKAYLNPEKQISETGLSTYEVVIVNLRNEESFYELDFNSKHGLKGEFTEKEFVIGPMEKKIVNLKVIAEEKGSYVFEVQIKGEGFRPAVRGLLIFGEVSEDDTSTLPTQTGSSTGSSEDSTSFFNGRGFALNSEETLGYLINLHLLKKDGIEGKFSFDHETFRVSGQTSDDKIEFQIFSSGKRRGAVGEFSGSIKNFNGFSLITGDLEFKDDKYKVTIIGEKERVFKIVKPEAQQEIVETNIGEITVIEQDNIDIIPTEVRKKKFLGIFPTGEKVLRVKIIDSNGEETTKEIPANSETEIYGKYKLEVGSLDNEQEFEFSVKSSE